MLVLTKTVTKTALATWLLLRIQSDYHLFFNHSYSFIHICSSYPGMTTTEKKVFSYFDSVAADTYLGAVTGNFLV